MTLQDMVVPGLILITFAVDQLLKFASDTTITLTQKKTNCSNCGRTLYCPVCSWTKRHNS